MTFNWSNAAEVAIVTGLNEIPVVGGILGGLVEIFWPESNEDIWAEIKDKVQAMIGQAITTDVYDRVAGMLGTAAEDNGLIGDINDFLGAANKSNGQNPSETWNAANTSFITASAAFQQAGYEVVLLPLFAQMANLHLTLVRDGMLSGYCNEAELTSRITLYTNYANQTMEQGMAARASASGGSYNNLNEFARFLQLTVGNFSALWGYFNSTAPVKNIAVDAEIFYTITEAMGTQFSSDNYSVPGAPAGDITSIGVYWLQDGLDNYNLVQGTQIIYTSGATPYTGILVGGEAPTNGGTNPTNGYYTYYLQTIAVSADNPITSIQGTYDTGGGTYCIGFLFKDGSSTSQVPSQASQSYPQGFTITAPPGYYLSSIWVPASWHWYNAAQDMVFGFRLDPESLFSG